MLLGEKGVWERGTSNRSLRTGPSPQKPPKAIAKGGTRNDEKFVAGGRIFLQIRYHPREAFLRVAGIRRCRYFQTEKAFRL